MRPFVFFFLFLFLFGCSAQKLKYSDLVDEQSDRVVVDVQADISYDAPYLECNETVNLTAAYPLFSEAFTDGFRAQEFERCFIVVNGTRAYEHHRNDIALVALDSRSVENYGAQQMLKVVANMTPELIASNSERVLVDSIVGNETYMVLYRGGFVSPAIDYDMRVFRERFDYE